MVGRNAVFVCFWICHLSWTESTDPFHELTSKLSKYTIVNPQLIHRWTRSIDTPPDSEGYEETTLSYSVEINGRPHLLHLKPNRDFLHPDFVQLTRDSADNYESSSGTRENCYYHGEVDGFETSMVALSTCAGLRGLIMLGNETYGLEPLRESLTNEHLLYLLRDVQSEATTCGVVSADESTYHHGAFDPGHSLTPLLRRRRALPQTSYVELALVVDNARYNTMKQNETAIRDEMVELANLLDGYYKPLNIRIVLMALVIFKDTNPFSVEGSAGEVLQQFVRWRKESLLPKIRHDVGQLIVGQPNPYGNVLGMAFVGTVCSVAHSGGINVYSNSDLVSASKVVAHEMGHNLGMTHDETRCQCNGEPCIMAAFSSGATSFSSCSERDFERLVNGGGGACLRNEPSPDDIIGTAECGNGRVDRGEECDCGKPEECKTKCCDAATCTFTHGSACAHGDCCENCQIRVAGTMCRRSIDTCDLPEYCDGKKANCADDFYIMDGLPCQNDAAYCYEGRCQTYDYQCRHLFAPDPAIKAADVCFSHANVQGNKFGNCGITNKGVYVKCTAENAMCGKVQCTNVDVNHPPPNAHVSIQIIDGSSCVNADFNLGPDVLDPAYVNPGSPCAPGKTCLDFKCVNASALATNLDCDAKTTCKGRGRCNDQGHCHCENGWAPPFCVTRGRGGSIDSGPAQIDHSLRDGLLIFFLLVLPLLVLLILVLLFFFRRRTFDPCLKKGRRSHSPQNGNTNTQPNVNGLSTVATQPPAQSPPQVPGSSPDTSAPISGFRYGELDYWNVDEKAAQPQPAGPRQGPGVPKPIPPKQFPDN